MIARKNVIRSLHMIVVLCCVVSLFSIPSQAQQAGTPEFDQGRLFTEQFYRSELDTLYARFSPDMKAALSREALTQFHAQIAEQFGSEKAILDETVVPGVQYATYARIVTFEKFANPMSVTWVIGSDHNILGFSIRPVPQEAASDYLDYRTDAELYLPFQGEWFVVWGGRSVQENYHAEYPDQRFAYDFLIVNNDTTHAGDGTKNEDYYCFGKKILAPAGGKVVEARDGVADNTPGIEHMNAEEPLGNYIILDHRNGEFSFLAHLQHGTVAVQQGDTVEVGQLLGLCGNSGHSSEAHLHYHLQTTAVFQQGEGLPAQFHAYMADGEVVERGEPTRGQQISRQLDE
jgi:hypothetical protein